MSQAMTEIQARIFSLKDDNYAVFQRKLLPTIDAASVIGVRTPQLRMLAKELRDYEISKSFLQTLPHKYFEENQLHAFLISDIRDFEQCVGELQRFLPYVDNWATCDQLSPRCFKKNAQSLLPHIFVWMRSLHAYTVRFGIGMLMRYFLDNAFRAEYLALVAGINSGEYYVKMMQAWFFATALAKQYDSSLPYLQNSKLEPWTHNKAIQKAMESYRIDECKKQYLKTLKIS